MPTSSTYNVAYFMAFHLYDSHKGGCNKMLWAEPANLFLTYKESIQHLKDQKYDPLLDLKGKHRIVLVGVLRNIQPRFDNAGLVEGTGICVAWTIPKQDKNHIQIVVSRDKVEAVMEKLEKQRHISGHNEPKPTLKMIAEQIRSRRI